MTKRIYEQRQTRKCCFSIEESLANEFMKVCDRRGYIASRVVQRLMEAQLIKWRTMKVEIIAEDTTYA